MRWLLMIYLCPVCDAVLKIKPGDGDAVACKIAALIDLGKVEEALLLISSGQELQRRFAFERAYCLYRNGKLQEALSCLDEVPVEREQDKLRLEAQLRYRLEDYSKAIEAYSELFKSHDEDSLEAKTNVVAAYIAGNRSDEIPAILEAMRSSPHDGLELAFNVACGLVAQGKLNEARNQLEAAHRIGEELLFEDGLDDEEVAAELAAVDAQLAYLDASEGKLSEAFEKMQDILDLDSSDDMANASATANLALCQISLYPNDRKGAQEKLRLMEVFFERRGGFLRVKPELEGQLGSGVCQEMLGVYSCTALCAHKIEYAKEAARSMDKWYPDNILGTMLHASILARDGKVKEALAAIESTHTKLRGSIELKTSVMAAQLATHLGDYVKASQLLASLPGNYSSMPAVVATMAALLEQCDDIDGARNLGMSILKGAGGQDAKKWALRRLADLDLAAGNLQSALSSLVEYTKLDENAWEDSEILSLLPRCIACCEPEKVEELVGLPSLPGTLGAADIDSLESQMATTVSVKSGVGNKEDDVIEKKKKKRKRKPRYPKNFDPENPGPPPDPKMAAKVAESRE